MDGILRLLDGEVMELDAVVARSAGDGDGVGAGGGSREWCWGQE